MKFTAVLLLLLSSFANADTLISPSYRFVLEQNCAEGEVSCATISGYLETKASGVKQNFTGETRHSLCADGVTPCRFQGYEVSAGGITYFLTDDGGISIIAKDGTVTGSEQGQWSWQESP